MYVVLLIMHSCSAMHRGIPLIQLAFMYAYVHFKYNVWKNVVLYFNELKQFKNLFRIFDMV